MTRAARNVFANCSKGDFVISLAGDLAREDYLICF